MKNLPLFLLLLFGIGPGGTAASSPPPLFTLRSSPEEAPRSYTQPEQQLAHCPRWDGEGDPPLAIATAIETAFDAVEARHPDEALDAFELISITYSRLAGSPVNDTFHWYAQVSLRAWSSQRGYWDRSQTATILLLMDGSEWREDEVDEKEAGET